MRLSASAFWIILSLLALPVQGQSTVLVSTSNVMPWGIEKQDSPNEGLLVEFINEFGKAADVQLKNRLKPYPRVINDIQTGNSDLAILIESPQSNDIGHSLGTVASVDIIAVAKSAHQNIITLSELDGEKVAYVRGSKYGPAFDNHPGFKKIPVRDMNQGLKMLMQNHVDVVVSTDQSIFYGVDSLGIEAKWLKKLLVISTVKVNLYLSKRSTLLESIERFRVVINRMKQTGVLERIFYERDYLSSQQLNRQESLMPEFYESDEIIVNRFIPFDHELGLSHIP